MHICKQKIENVKDIVKIKFLQTVKLQNSQRFKYQEFKKNVTFKSHLLIPYSGLNSVNTEVLKLGI